MSITPTDVVDDASRMLEGLENCDFFTHVWNGETIRRILHENEEKMILTLIRFFPESYASTLPLLRRLLENLIEIVEPDDMSEVIFQDTEDLVDRIIDLSSSTDITNIKMRLGEAILWRLNHTGESLNLLYPLLDEWVEFADHFSDAFIHALISYIEDVCVSEMENKEGNEEIKFEKESGVAFSKNGNQFLIYVPIICKKGNKKKLKITVDEDDYSCEIVNAE